MARYSRDFRGDRFRRGGGGPGYDMDFGNWGARSGLDRDAARYDRELDRNFSGGGWVGGGPPPHGGGWGTSGSRAVYDEQFRHDGYRLRPGDPRNGGYRRFGGYDEGYRGARDGYDREFGGGWGMSRLHQEMMRGRGEGFGRSGDYHRSHPIRPEELGGSGPSRSGYGTPWGGYGGGPRG